ncbi:MAG TPA: hypothetical protein VKT29_07995, partial [Terriglobales bacterium]|nr:hypothetical protein [Terriglobales bacterium]
KMKLVPEPGTPPSALAPFYVLDPIDFATRPLRPEKTSFAFAPMDWPDYSTVSQLPFNGLLYPSTK